MQIGEPIALTRFPRSKLNSGRTYFAPVYSTASGLKRRRQEICTAVDGDSINVYDVRNGKNLSSFALPPDSALACAPCSLHSATSTGDKYRNTYFVSKRRNQTTISVFEEQLGGAVQKPASRSIPLDGSKACIVGLEVLGSREAYEILVAREDGHYEIYDTQLSSQLNSGRFGGCSANTRLVAVLWMSPSQAAKSILKARPDVLSLTDAGSSFVVAVFSKSEPQAGTGFRGVEFGIWQISQMQSSVQGDKGIAPIIHQEIYVSSSLLPNDQNPIVFAFKNTRMIIRTQSKLHIINIALITPRQIQEITPVATDQISSLFISDALTLSSTSATIQLHQTQLNTIQTKLDLNKIGQKRKRGASLGGPITLLAFFPSLNRVVGYRRDQLAAMDLQIPGSESFPEFIKQTSLLINNVGLGSLSQDKNKLMYKSSECLVGRTIAPSEQSSSWHSTTNQLEQCLHQGDTVGFEEAAIECLLEEQQSHGPHPQVAAEYKVDYIIAKVFKYNDTLDGDLASTTGRLSLAIQVQNLIKVLATEGYLSTERINKVLRSSVRSQFEPVNHGTVSDLLAESDSSLGLLRFYLEQAPFIAYQELFAATSLLLRRALVATHTDLDAHLDASRSPVSSKNGPGDLMTTLAQPHGVIPTNITTCLCIAIQRLSDTTQGILSSLMRNSLSQREIIALIQFLRQQLFRSGYTRLVNAELRVDSTSAMNGFPAEQGTSASSKSEMTIDSIASMLSSCMDAIGTIGILSSGAEEDFVQKLIPELSSEITRATEAVRDATFLEGVLRETLRFVESNKFSQNKMTVDEGGTIEKESKAGAILTLYSEPLADGSLDQYAEMLPLSLRAEGRVNPVKVRKGDGKTSRRSAREVGMLQDRQRGPYALERLVL